MPSILNFRILDFKGIEDVHIDIEGKFTCPVLTLIGLNESGKTTILEALSHFTTGDRSVSSLFDGPYAAASGLKLIPLHLKAAYNGEIKISSQINLDYSDLEGIKSLAAEHNFVIDENAIANKFIVYRAYTFEDSVLHSALNYWTINLLVKEKHEEEFKKYQRADKDNDLWLKIIRYIEPKIPNITYFPTFLVDTPHRIYLQEHKNESPINRHYRFVFQDILDSLGGELNLQKHVCNRINDYKTKLNSPSWISKFFGSLDKGPMDSVFQKISHAITREVLGSWRRIFQRSISASSIVVDWQIDSEMSDMPYATFWVSDGESRYAIDERSLGFRWFFSFLLFTAFKKQNKRKTIFLFDEPAANLHAKAQAELLDSFSRIASDGNKIIYSTHSHHMVNPQWLNSAYIVENSALDYDKLDNFDLDTKPTNIKAIPYRQFVSDFPSRTSYFQPVIEKLEYTLPQIIGSGPYVVLEGISDYYALEAVKRSKKKANYNYSLMPGTGSGASDALISQMIGQGQNFIVLLDDDREGNTAKQRYTDGWFFEENVIITLADLDQEFKGYALEKILGEETYGMIKNHLSATNKPSKKQVGWYLSEAFASQEPIEKFLSKSAIEKITLVLDLLKNHFEK